MHELALARSLVGIIVEEAARAACARVRRVVVEIGVLSHVEPGAMVFCFDAVARGTPAEGAELVIERPAGLAYCSDCAREVPVAARGEPCPRCGGFALVVAGGEELRLSELEVE